ncbi:hypothetical protein DMP17_15585 [Pseudonocardia sp. TMWB2A]|uniref:SpoIIE family protein phosphatase n=1 Tax=Pseudonocardia sp. TMWB2A TaxID=687430 RepID=UPI00307DA3B6
MRGDDDAVESTQSDLVHAAMAAHDWSSHPLGPPERWSPDLRSVVRMLLDSRFSMWMAWGPDLTMFYNDAYRRDTLRDKHPWALGRSAREVWAEVWDDVSPLIGSVLAGGGATWDEDLLLFLERSGYPEETYHTFSYSPLHEDGAVAGMLCVVTENTDRVLSERRMQTLRDLAADLGPTRTGAQVYAAVGRALAGNPQDVPFGLVYEFTEDGGTRLAGSAGIAPDAPGADPAGWPLDPVREGGTAVVDDLAARLPGLPHSAWDRPPSHAVLVPLAGAQGETRIRGALVVGLNPFRTFDERYRAFVDLLAGQVGAALVAAGAYEAERERAEALAELDRAKTDFFSNVSHEFRTPLTLIMGPVEQLRDDPPGPDRLAAELDVVHRNALRLGRLVTTLLDFSRLQAGRLRATFEPTDLAAFTTELTSLFRSAMERAGLDYTVDCPPLPGPVHVDRESWEKVVLNLLSNALKFTLDGRVAVALRADGDDAVELTVADTGAGIPAEELPRLFERFHRIAGARARSTEGSGIGLAMTRELVTLHGGTITAASTAGAGTTFTVRIPTGTAHLDPDRVADTASGGAPTATSEAFVGEALRWLPGPAPAPVVGDGAGPGAPASAGRILVADDNADMREYLQRLLADRYEVQLVEDGKSALTAARERPPDLVVTDIMMPVLDGMELLAALRGDRRTAGVPVLLLSARAGEEAAIEGLGAGADDYLVKPFSAAELVARVNAHLKLGRGRRDAEARFTAMADLAPALIWVADPDGARTYVNSGWQEFTGREVPADLGDGWTDGLHPQDRQRYRDRVAPALASGTGWQIEYRLRRADGAFRWILEHAVPLHTGTDGTVTGWVGSGTDINVRYRESERQTLLARLSRELDSSDGVDNRLRRLTALLVETRLADVCTVRRVDDAGQLVRVARCGPDAVTEEVLDERPAETSFGLQVLDAGAAVLWDDTAPGAMVPGSPIPARSAVGVPLSARGRALAVLVLVRGPRTTPYAPDDIELVTELADRAALALDNALLLADERANADRLALLQRATAQLSAAADPTEVARTVVTHLRALLGTCRIAVYELDPAGQQLRALALHDVADPQAWREVPLSSPAPAAVTARQARALWLEPGTDWRERHPELATLLDGLGHATVFTLPLVTAARTVGVIAVAFGTPRPLTPSERATLLALTDPAAQALERARLYRAEREVAHTLQRTLLPTRLPDLDTVEIAVRYQAGAAGTEAGGDWYDVVDLGGGRVGLSVGDVVGQGVAAAAVMAQLRTVLSGAVRQGRDPASALELLDEFATWIPGARYSTAACVVVDPGRGELRWARAGHLPVLVVDENGSRYLAGGHNPVLGIRGRPPFGEGVAPIAAGQTLVLYTDGLVERRGEVVDEGLDRLARIAAEVAGLPPEQFADQIVDRALAGAAHTDDAALVCVRVLPPDIDLTVPGSARELPGMRRRVRRWAGHVGLGEDLGDDLVRAIDEAAANSVEHGYAEFDPPGEVRLRLGYTPHDGVRAQVADTGRWRPPPPDPGYRGRGLQMIRAIATTAEIDTAGRGTVVRMRITPDPHTPAVAQQPAPPVRPSPGRRRTELHDDGRSGDARRLTLAGDLDLAGAAEIRDRLLELVAAGPVLLVLDGPTYVASNGSALLAEAADRAGARGQRLRVEVPPGPARHALELSGLLTLLG